MAFKKMFQSLDWVDVDFDCPPIQPNRIIYRFNPSTGLMLISTDIVNGGKREIAAVSIPRLG